MPPKCKHYVRIWEKEKWSCKDCGATGVLDDMAAEIEKVKKLEKYSNLPMLMYYSEILFIPIQLV